MPVPAAKTRAQQIRDYFDLLMRLARGAEGERRDDLFDRIERAIAMGEAEAKRQQRAHVRCGTGWPA